MRGFKEYHYEEHMKKTKYLEKNMMDFLKEEGFERIYTPNLEEYSLYQEYDDSMKKEMIKTIDQDNKILVLRPDMTIPAARIASKLDKKDIMFSYSSTIYREYHGLRTHGKDFLQCGIEVFGDRSCEKKIISLGIKSLFKVGLTDLIINLSNVKFFEEIINDLKLASIQEDRLLALIERRNREDLKTYLQTLNKSGEKILHALNLYGDYKTSIQKARSFSNDAMNEALDQLESLGDQIKEKFPTVKVNVDLGRATPLKYYNDTYFEIYAAAFNVSLLSGGRYDDLLKNLGSNLKAAGFGINLNLVEEAIDHKGSSKLKIALAKGRIQKECMKKFEEGKLEFEDYSKESRKLIFESTNGKYEIVFVKTSDVATYVENGACDLGIVGSDMLRETEHNVYELENLDIGKCRMSVATLNGKELDYNDLTVASKYPNISKRYFSNRGVFPNIIKLNGSVELGPIVGLADCIIDIVESGNTLRENGLYEVDRFMDISSRIIANKFSLIHKSEEIREIVNLLRSIVCEK